MGRPRRARRRAEHLLSESLSHAVAPLGYRNIVSTDSGISISTRDFPTLRLLHPHGAAPTETRTEKPVRPLIAMQIATREQFHFPCAAPTSARQRPRRRQRPTYSTSAAHSAPPDIIN